MCVARSALLVTALVLLPPGTLRAADVAGPTLAVVAKPWLATWERLADLPDARGVAGAFAGVCGGEDGGRWEAATPLPAPLGYGVSATFGGRVWCVGGCDGKRHVASAVALAWDAAACRITVEPDALPPLPKPVAYAAGVVAGSRLYIAGGQETPEATTALGSLWSIDLAAAAGPGRDGTIAQPPWQEHPPCPGPPRILSVLGTHAGRVILVSGAELVAAPGAGTAGVAAVTRRFLRDAYAFDPQTHTWTVLASPPVPIVAAAGPALPAGGGRLAFLPGDDGALFERRAELAGRHPGFPRGIYLYDTSADAWHAAGDIPTAIATPVTTPAVAWRGGAAPRFPRAKRSPVSARLPC